MEFHETDPTTDPTQDPWDEVSARFTELGERLKSTYRKAADDMGPSEEEIKGAFNTLGGAWNQLAGSFSEALRDTETREQLKGAATSLASALGRTLTDLSAEFTAQSPDPEEE